MDYASTSASDNTYATTTASSNVPMYIIAARSDTPGQRARLTWEGRSTVDASTANILIDNYRFGSLNSWTNTTTNSTLSADTDGTIRHIIDSNLSESYESRDGGYWSYFRVSQQSSSASLQTDYILVEFEDVPSATSTANQTFVYSDGNTAIDTITITEGASPTINTTDDLRIKIPSTFNAVWDETITAPTFGGTANSGGRVNATVSYPDSKTLLITIDSDFIAGDTLTIAGLKINPSAATAQDNFDIILDGSADTDVDQTDAKTIGVRGTSDVSAHSAVEAENELDTVATSVTNAVLYTFKITPAGEDETVTHITFTLADLSGISDSDFSNLELYYDSNSDGLAAAETQVGGTGYATTTGSTGTITFTVDFTVIAGSRDYILVGDISGLSTFGEGFKIQLRSSGVTSIGATSVITITHASNGNVIKHTKLSVHGGGSATGGTDGGGNSQTGGGPGGGDPGGGGDGGGNQQGGGGPGGGEGSP